MSSRQKKNITIFDLKITIFLPKKSHYLPKSTGNTQEAVAPPRYDLKIVDWDVKPQPKQTKQNKIAAYCIGVLS